MNLTRLIFGSIVSILRVFYSTISKNRTRRRRKKDTGFAFQVNGDRFAAAQKIKSRVTCTIVTTSGVSRIIVELIVENCELSIELNFK